MKREGRQHGMVRAYTVLSGQWNPHRPNGRIINELTSPPTAGHFTKVPARPTNHSKFTSKCSRSKCHDCHPGGKSKAKAKGAYKKASSCDTMSSYRLITWRVVDDTPGFKASGFSASSMLDYLGDGNFSYMDHHCDDNNNEHESSPREIEEVDDIDDSCGDDDHRVDDDNEDGMSFCEVGFVWESMDGDDSWCLVEEM